MTYRDVTRKLRRLGCEELPRRGSGSHRKWIHREHGTFAPIPDWGPKDLKLGTLRQIIRLLNLDWQEFLQA